MPDLHREAIQDAEREELNAVAAALDRSPRLARLVRYIGDRYFQNQLDQLHEYNIATEVFGRSKTTFDAGDDAIARVEAHRLRKRLKEYYAGEGKEHKIQLAIPPGSYVPVFNRLSSDNASAPANAGEPANPDPNSPNRAQVEAGTEKFRAWTSLRNAKYVLLPLPLIACILAAAVAMVRFKPAIAGQIAENKAVQQSVPPKRISSGVPGSEPIRIMCGSAGSPQTDVADRVWEPDRFFHNGGTWRLSPSFVARTSSPLLFDTWRTGDFSYDIPLKPGTYELHLYFITTERSSDNTSTFTVSINGEHVLNGFDINSDALGENIADERVFKDVSPGKDGYLHLGFSSERGAPVLSALEVLPGILHKQLPIRLVTQLTSFTDHNGVVWGPDDYYMNGHLSTKRQPVAGSSDPDLFSSERYGHFTYAIPVDTRGRYTLILHFAEFYFGPQASGVGGVGNRLFRFFCNGEILLDNFDIYKEGGSLRAVTKTFTHLKPSPQGKLNLTFEPIENNATISGIEVLGESE